MNLDLLDRLAGLALAFGRVERATLHGDRVRQETDAEHTVMLGLVAVEVAGLYPLYFNPHLVAHFALVHDLVEAETPGGDTNSFDISPTALAGKKACEEVGLWRLRERFAGTAMLAMIERYESQLEPEARFVRYLDKVMPKLTHARNACAAIKAMGKTLADLQRAHREQGAALAAQYPELAALVSPIFDDACKAAEEAW